jgi:hypothetical protein
LGLLFKVRNKMSEPIEGESVNVQDLGVSFGRVRWAVTTSICTYHGATQDEAIANARYGLLLHKAVDSLFPHNP